jgi:sulfite exporter TauE/SafE
MVSLLEPAAAVNRRSLALWIIALLVLSAVAVLVAAAAMPPGYSWRTHSISESAAQGLQHAWIARLAFVGFGAAVLALSLAMRTIWARSVYWMHLAFAAFMLQTAAFSHKPWMDDAPFDDIEDILHSVTADGMGLAFCIGVFARFVQRGRDQQLRRVFDIVAVVLATAMPLVLATSAVGGGVAQRLMFAIGYVWYAMEARSLRGTALDSA